MTDFRYVTAWKKNDPQVEKDVLATWRENKSLPGYATPEKRLAELCVIAYSGEEVAGISSIELAYYPPLKRRFGFFRAFTVPKFGRQDIARHLAVHCRDTIREWSIAHPEEQISGMMAFYQAKGMGRTPVGFSGLTLIGYSPEGYQVRLVWFDHIRIQTEAIQR